MPAGTARDPQAVAIQLRCCRQRAQGRGWHLGKWDLKAGSVLQSQKRKYGYDSQSSNSIGIGFSEMLGDSGFCFRLARTWQAIVGAGTHESWNGAEPSSDCKPFASPRAHLDLQITSLGACSRFPARDTSAKVCSREAGKGNGRIIP